MCRRGYRLWLGGWAGLAALAGSAAWGAGELPAALPANALAIGQQLPVGPVVQPQAQQPVKVLPMPRRVTPVDPNRRLPQLGDEPCPLAQPPVPDKRVVERFGNFVKEVVDPQNNLELVIGRPRLLMLKTAPKRVQVADEKIAAYSMISPTEVSVLGKGLGCTVLNLWFTDPKDKSKEEVLSYLVRVLPSPDSKKRLERIYRNLQDEINHAFPDSLVSLFFVGDKLVVTGQAKDIADATQIMRIVHANAPFEEVQHLDQLAQANGPVAFGPGNMPPGLMNALLKDSAHVINLLRIPGEQQVMLRVTVAEVNRAAARSIGLDFSINNKHGTTVFANTTGSITTGGLSLFNSPFGGFGVLNQQVAPGVAFGTGGFNNLPASLDNGQVRLAISALRNLNYARSLAEPNLVTMNGQTANFQAGGQFPVPVVGGFALNSFTGVNFVPFGVQLSFTPYITDKDRIRLAINAEVSSRDLEVGATNIGGAAVPTISTRNFQTTVELREGQTLAVAGLVQNNLGANSGRVPFFGDLPIVGRLFCFDQVMAGEQELVVLITPELVHPLEHKEVPALPGSDLFEPSDLEFYLLGRLESRRNYDYRSPVMTDWDRMKRYHHMEQIYIAGPHGHADCPE
jgi:pilus assembly protein CpaC